MSQQFTLFPVVLTQEEPANFETADLKLIGHDAQGRRYALKTLDDSPLLPLTEWLAYQLCAAVGQETPEFAVVERLDGTKAFGSRWDETAKQLDATRIPMPEFLALLQDSVAGMWPVYAIDAFLNNNDRHLGNFLIRNIGKRISVLAFDWSRMRALEAAPFTNWPWPKSCKSAVVYQFLSQSFGPPDLAAIQRRLRQIAGITAQQVGQIIDAAPEEWRQGVDSASIMSWWAANAAERSSNSLTLLTP